VHYKCVYIKDSQRSEDATIGKSCECALSSSAFLRAKAVYADGFFATLR